MMQMFFRRSEEYVKEALMHHCRGSTCVRDLHLGRRNIAFDVISHKNVKAATSQLKITNLLFAQQVFCSCPTKTNDLPNR